MQSRVSVLALLMSEIWVHYFFSVMLQWGQEKGAAP